MASLARHTAKPNLTQARDSKGAKLNEKRYQVFISSTFNDLREERRAVQDVIISTGDFPVQMESFPAADEDQFAFIKSLIDVCDYYVLIIAGKYGTVAEDGMSYTEKEFHYAVSIGVPVLVMIHGEPGGIPADKSETTEAGKKRLLAFIEKAESSRLRKTWTTLDGLKLATREALDYAKATKPRVGWVRGDAVASIEALEELNDIRKENDKFKKALGDSKVGLVLPSIPAADEAITIDLLPNTNGRNYKRSGVYDASVVTTWISTFPLFQMNLQWGPGGWEGEDTYYIREDESCVNIGSAIAGEVASIDTENCFKISKNTLNRLVSYYIEVGLMNPLDSETPFTEIAQKIARRHVILGHHPGTFEISKGSISVVSPSSTPKVDNIDDDIPF